MSTRVVCPQLFPCDRNPLPDAPQTAGAGWILGLAAASGVFHFGPDVFESIGTPFCAELMELVPFQTVRRPTHPLPNPPASLIIGIAPKCKVKPVWDLFHETSQIGQDSRITMAWTRATDEQFTISQLAKAAEIPTTTVRYYERIGLVEPEDRSRGNYRLYSDQSLSKLKFIRAAQAIGFTLNDVKTLLSDDAGGTPTCGSVQRLIEDRLEDIEERLKDLRHVHGVLMSALEKCRRQRKTDCCHVVEGLRAGR